MAELDFRYTLDGKEVEAFQVTEETLFAEKRWPAWMNSKMLMTKGDSNSTKAAHWLTVDDVETPIPKYGWIVRDSAGNIRAEDYEVMETAIKLVEDPGPERDAPTEVDEESLIQLQAAMQKRDPDEIRAELAEKRAKQPPKPDDYPVVVDVAAGTIEFNDPVGVPAVPVSELISVLEVLKHDKAAGINALKASASERVKWCSCPPGHCSGGDIVGCRQNSPLAAQEAK
jgi:hypothetical protein